MAITTMTVTRYAFQCDDCGVPTPWAPTKERAHQLADHLGYSTAHAPTFYRFCKNCSELRDENGNYIGKRQS